ncbi:hypothetical protein RM553_10320 [Zunongwangia sp. F363]|uniref:Glycerophosphoryl diester phosphodiesterase membrane domain-containing protein n=1 Tax=Autumnicola tepida TaxID=3075595 RepID=A0ABU3CA51_9FLAO|nr:hypothetical protein [Zunongwangia sp. F363]MDT0643222.1 hypothetical protein [Zunongwangia sp. F363]
MNSNYIRFKQQRELGDILSVLFKFLRENYKTFFTSFFKFVTPAFILLIAAISYYTYSTVGSPVFSTGALSEGEVIVSVMVLAVSVLLYSAVLNGTVLHYVRSYIANNGDVVQAEVGQGVKQDLGKLIGLQVIVWVLTVAGLMLFLIPGIYVSVPLSLSAAVLVFRRTNITDSISEAFQLIKNNWWITFFTIFVIVLLIYVISFIFQLPLLIYTIIKMFTVFQENSAGDMSGVFDWVYMLLSIIPSIFQYILYSILPLGLSFVYFNLNERQNFTGTFESIENLGKHD